MAMETREAAPAHFICKIESFSLLKKCGIDEYETREFDAGNYKWRLVIYPNGQGIVKAEEYVSVNLAISATDSLPKNWEVNVVFSIFIFNHISDNYVFTPGKKRRFFPLQTEWGFCNFISKKVLTTPSNGYLADDSCLFGAEVFVNDNRLAIECLSLNDVGAPCKHVIKITNFSTLEYVWYSEEFVAGGYTWKLQLFPNGDEYNKSNVSIYMSYVASDTCEDRVKAYYSVCLKNQSAAKNHKRTDSDWFGASSLTWGWSSFISTAQLNSANAGFIVNDTCLLEIELRVQAVAA